jgi:hypothetical protein
VYQEKAEQTGHGHAGDQPADPARGPLAADDDFDKVGEQENVIDENDGSEDILREHFEHPWVRPILIQAPEPGGDVRKEDCGIHDKHDEEVQPAIHFARNIGSKELIERAQCDGQPDKQHHREHSGSENVLEEPPVVLPEGVGFGTPQQGKSGNQEVESRTQLKVSNRFVLALGAGPLRPEEHQQSEAAEIQQRRTRRGPATLLGEESQGNSEWKPQGGHHGHPDPVGVSRSEGPRYRSRRCQHAGKHGPGKAAEDVPGSNSQRLQ